MILYGSIRYWLYFMHIPQAIVDALRSDAYQLNADEVMCGLVWAESRSSIQGGERRSREHRTVAYIPVDAAWRQEKSAGAGS